MSQRRDRVDDLLRSELARILQRELRDPRVGMASITEVRVTGDLSYAEVRVSVLGEEEERQASIHALDRAKGFLRSALARNLRLRKTPELRFELDRGAEHAQNISDILEHLEYHEPEGT